LTSYIRRTQNINEDRYKLNMYSLIKQKSTLDAIHMINNNNSFEVHNKNIQLRKANNTFTVITLIHHKLNY